MTWIKLFKTLISKDPEAKSRLMNNLLKKYPAAKRALAPFVVRPAAQGGDEQAVEVLEEDTLARLKGFRRRLDWFLENRSDLAVFDAQHLKDGPLARVHLSHRVPAGFHGNWRDAA